MGTTGCVSWSFAQKGVIIIDNEAMELDEDTVLMDVLEAGADDLKNEGQVYEVHTSPEAFAAVSSALEKKKYRLLSAQLEMVPSNYVSVTGESDVKNLQKMLDMFEDNDDIQNVWHNWEEG
jgi:transcriptional/translational regulatory protein YebC/TACO1